jgi:glycosyltransferase involved in cell wall biosynthesis
MENKRLPVSIIIPAFNSQATIGLCLDSVRKLSYPSQKLEIILVDNGSTDETPFIASCYGAKVFIRPRIFVSEMRNFGAMQAGGDIYGFIDSDCIISPDWLTNGLRHLDNPGVGAAGCGYALNTPPCWIEKHWLYMHLSPVSQVNFLPAGNMLIKKSTFWNIGGFNSRIETGEDSELCLRLRKAGFRIISDSDIKNVHLGNPKSLIKFLRKEIWYGKGLAACINAHDWTDRTFLLTNLFLLSLLSLMLGAVMFPISGNPIVAFAGISGASLVIALSTVYRSVRRRTCGSVPPLALLNTVYYLGRSVSLFKIYFNLFKNLFGNRSAT